jgi:hypothetical protein
MGRYGEAANTLREIPSRTIAPEAVQEAVRLLRAAPAQANLSHIVPLGFLGFVYIYVGTPNTVLDFYEGLVEVGYLNPAPLSLLWAPAYAPVRKTERFQAYVRKAGMLDYWRARGWPDHCRPIGADDFACD